MKKWTLEIRKLNDQNLMSRTENLVQVERELLTEVLHYLHEILRRRLFSALGYKSLFDFCVRRLGYSEDQAYRRIAAMKLLEEIPELEEHLNSGSLTLTHVGVAQNLFRQEKKVSGEGFTAEKKSEILREMSSGSVREAEKVAMAYASVPKNLRPDQVTVLTEELIELRMKASKDLLEKIDRLKGMLAHKYPHLSLGELFELLSDLGLHEWNPARRPKSKIKKQKQVEKRQDEACSEIKRVPSDRETHLRQRQTKTRSVEKSASNQKSCVKDRGGLTKNDLNSRYERSQNSRLPKPPRPPRRPPPETRRTLFALADQACENCQSTFALEVDHRRPVALGGSDEPNNLRVLCRSCNQRAAIESFGLEQMSVYI